MNIDVYAGIIKKIVELLSYEDYEAIVRNDYERRLTPEEIKIAIKEYGGDITLPPEENYNRMDVYQVRDRDEVIIDFDLWIDNGKSDLTLTVRIINVRSSPEYVVEDIHVL